MHLLATSLPSARRPTPGTQSCIQNYRFSCSALGFQLADGSSDSDVNKCCIGQVPGMTPPDLTSYTFDNQGAAIECRINAENPSAGYAPSSGVAAVASASSPNLLNVRHMIELACKELWALSRVPGQSCAE